jgi:hypothetical protein
MFKTINGILTPDGKLILKDEKLPEFPIEVMVTLLQPALDTDTVELGDYNEKLISYEEKLAKGEIAWK